MTRFFVHIYDILSKHRQFTFILLSVFVAIMAFLASGLKYEEDISRFLPTQEKDSSSISLILNASNKIYKHLSADYAPK